MRIPPEVVEALARAVMEANPDVVGAFIAVDGSELHVKFITVDELLEGEDLSAVVEGAEAILRDE